MDFPRDVRDRVYEYVLEQSLSEAIVIRLEKDKEFGKPRTTAKLGLSLKASCKQVHDEVEDMIFSRVFKFSNLDVLLAFLVKSATARQRLRHVDVQLESGPFDLDYFALLALSQLHLHTLTLRCHAVQGREEDWTRSIEINVLLQTRGVRRVTLGPVDQTDDPDVSSLTTSCELGHKLITLLQRPAYTPREDPCFSPIMPDVIEEPEYPCLGYSVTDFEDLEDEEPSDIPLLDPICGRHKDSWWCDCIGSSTPDHQSFRLTDSCF